MTEFDFDELDKAVNSLMKKTPGNDDTSDTTENVVTLPSEPTSPAEPAPPQPQSSPSVDSQPSPSTSDQSTPPPAAVEKRTVPAEGSVPNRTVATSSASAAPKVAETAPAVMKTSSQQEANEGLVTKRRGTFMDVVHPSSDMRTKSATVAPRPVSRQAPDITPSSEEASSLSGTIEGVRQPAKEPVVPRTLDDRALATTMAEVNSLAATTPSAEGGSPDSPKTSTGTSANMSLDMKSTTTPAANAQSKESLFIPDAKVEKRPLGTQSLTGDTNGEVSKPAQTPTKTQLPAELSSKVMAIESEQETTQKQTTTAQSGATSSSRQRSAPPVVATAPEIGSDHSEVVDEDHPAIYDPAYYQQEASKPKAKKKSGLWVVLAIIGLIILGGAGGVVYYFYSTGSF